MKELILDRFPIGVARAFLYHKKEDIKEKLFKVKFLNPNFNFTVPSYAFSIRIYTPHQGQGHGSKLLEDLKSEIRTIGGKSLFGTVDPIGNPNFVFNDVVQWYIRHGFEIIGYWVFNENEIGSGLNNHPVICLEF